MTEEKDPIFDKELEIVLNCIESGEAQYIHGIKGTLYLVTREGDLLRVYGQRAKKP